MNCLALVGRAGSCSLREPLAGPFWASFWSPGVLHSVSHLSRPPASCPVLSLPQKGAIRGPIPTSLPAQRLAVDSAPGKTSAGKESRSSGRLISQQRLPMPLRGLHAVGTPRTFGCCSPQGGVTGSPFMPFAQGVCVLVRVCACVCMGHLWDVEVVRTKGLAVLACLPSGTTN